MKRLFTILIISAAALMPASITSAQDSADVRLVGEVPYISISSPNHVLVDGGIMYSIDPNRLKVFNVHNLRSPQVISSINLNYTAWNLIKRDNILFIHDSDGGRTDMLNVSNPLNIERIGYINIPISESVAGVRFLGDYLLHANDDFVIYNASEFPELDTVSIRGVMGKPRTIEVRDSIAFVLCNAKYGELPYARITPIDFSEAHRPIIRDSFSLQGFGADTGHLYNGIIVYDRYLYAFTERWFLVLAIGERGDLSLCNQFRNGNRAVNGYIYNGHLILHSERDFRIFDLSEPESPELIAQLRTNGYFLKTNSIVGCFLITTLFTYGYEVIDLSDLSQPRLFTRVALNGLPQQVKLAGPYAVVNCIKKLSIVDPYGLNGPIEISSYVPLTNVVDFEIVNDSLVVACLENEGVDVLAISNPQQPFVLSHIDGNFDIDGNFNGIGVKDDIIYLVDYNNNGISVISLAEPEIPEQLGFFQFNFLNFKLLVEDNRLFSLAWEGFFIFDISNPEIPELITRYDFFRGWVTNFAVVNNLLCILKDFSGIEFYDISNPLHPDTIGACWARNSFCSVSGDESGNYLYLAGGNTGFRIFDISHPDRPISICRYRPPGRTVYDVQAQGQLAFSCEDSRLAIYDCRRALAAGSEELKPPQNRDLSLKLYPNPANSWTTLHFRLDHPQTVEASVIDSQGRIAASFSADFEAGEDLAWRIERELPTGVYILRVKTESSCSMAKVVWLK